jgi:hypothetical protein
VLVCVWWCWVAVRGSSRLLCMPKPLPVTTNRALRPRLCSHAHRAHERASSAGGCPSASIFLLCPPVSPAGRAGGVCAGGHRLVLHRLRGQPGLPGPVRKLGGSCRYRRRPPLHAVGLSGSILWKRAWLLRRACRMAC